MQTEKRVQTDEKEYCKVNVVYDADSGSVKKKMEEAVVALRNSPIPGFRAGKAPDHAIRARCKKQITAWVIRELTAQAYDDILYETKIKPIGYPKIHKVDLKDDENFSCELTVLKKPEFDLQEYKGFEIPRPHFNNDETAQLEASLQDLRVRFGDVEPYGESDFVELKDQVTLDFEASVDEKVLDEHSSKGILYTVGQGQFTGFDDNLLGMSAGEDREFDLDIPEGVPNIGGKKVHFKVHIHMGTKAVPAPLDDELAKKVGLNSLDELKAQLKELVSGRIKEHENKLVRQQVSRRLINAHEFSVPEWLLEMEAQHLVTQNNLEWKKLSGEEKDVFMKQAGDNVKLSLLLDSIRDVEPEAVLSESEAVNGLKERVKAQGGDQEKFVVEAQKSGQLFGLIAALRDEFTLQWVMNNSKIVD